MKAKIINGKLYDYDNNIEADIKYDIFKKEITNSKGEIFKEGDFVEFKIDNRIFQIFKIVNKDLIVCYNTLRKQMWTYIESLKHTNKECYDINKYRIKDELQLLDDINEYYQKTKDM